jgi:hypothetical protein
VPTECVGTDDADLADRVVDERGEHVPADDVDALEPRRCGDERVVDRTIHERNAPSHPVDRLLVDREVAKPRARLRGERTDRGEQRLPLARNAEPTEESAGRAREQRDERLGDAGHREDLDESAVERRGRVEPIARTPHALVAVHAHARAEPGRDELAAARIVGRHAGEIERDQLAARIAELLQVIGVRGQRRVVEPSVELGFEIVQHVVHARSLPREPAGAPRSRRSPRATRAVGDSPAAHRRAPQRRRP